MKRILPTIMIVVIFSSQVYSWGKTGHMLVAAIAYNKLDPEQKYALIQILEHHPNIAKWDAEFRTLKGIERGQFLMMRASTWPDEIRSEDNINHQYHRPDWHFITYELKFPNPDTKPESKIKPNVVTAIGVAADKIKDSDLDDKARAMYLAWLIHLVGDIHQPLHCASLFNSSYPHGDKGGNMIWVLNGDGPVKLHSLWDDSPGENAKAKPVSELAARLISEYETMPAGFDPIETSRESFSLAASDAHRNGSLNGGKSKETATALPQNYAASMKELAFKQCNLGGKHLAILLNGLTLLYDGEESAN